jgi:tetratricopeptide (TPR) repeat protein
LQRTVPQHLQCGRRFGGKLVSNSSGEVFMVLHDCAKVSSARLYWGLIFVIGACGFAVRNAHAVPCAVVHHGPLSDADKAYLAANYKTSEDLYRAQVAASPGDPASTQGLVHTLLREEKIPEAANAVQAALAATPTSAALIELRGEVEYRQGEPWEAAKSATQAFKLDPCNPRVRLLFARLSRVGSFYAQARASVLAAHQLDPDDPEILMEWISTLPLKQRITELQTYLAAPHGNDADEQRQLKELLDDLKKLEAEPQKPCRLVSQVTSTRLPIESIIKDPHQMDGWGSLPSHSINFAAVGLDVKLNNHSSQLQIDTGADGLLVTDAVAKRAGLRSFSQGEVGGIGDEGNRRAYTAFADSIRIGDLEFQNCAVEVVDAVTMPSGADGLIGADVFSDFLVTLDFPMRQVLLQPLPPLPGQSAAADVKLDTGHEAPNDSGEDAHAQAAPAAGTAAPAAPKPAGRGPYDRYIAPEMKDYTPVYRVGHDLLIPTQLNGTKLKLFILDTGSFATTISPQAAREFTKIDGGSAIDVRGLSGNVKRTYSVSDIVFHFADISQKVSDVVSFDTAKTSKSIGMEVSGFIGATALRQLTIHIDYRDGLVKFDYDPKRGFRY